MPNDRLSILRAHASWDGLLLGLHHRALDEKAWAEATLVGARDVFCGEAGLALYSLERPLHHRAEDAPVVIDVTEGSVEISVRPTTQRMTVLAARLDGMRAVAARERQVLTRIGLYLEAAHRRRLRPDLVVGPLREDSPTDLWSALVAGERTLVAHTIADAGITYEVLANDRAAAAARTLTARESRVLTLAVDGMAGKAISLDVGVPCSGVSRALASAAAKIGATSTIELLRIGGQFARASRHSRENEQSLTAAEHDVLQLIRRGLPNDQIAGARRRSIHTVANQVASILRKTGHASRRALLVSGMRFRTSC